MRNRGKFTAIITAIARMSAPGLWGLKSVEGEDSRTRRDNVSEKERRNGRGCGIAAPYLRNFKLNCDVFKLTFLPQPLLGALTRPSLLSRSLIGALDSR